MSCDPHFPVLGIDPGARWTACVLRHGVTAVTGWTLGPVAADGSLDARAMSDVDDLEALSRYLRRVLDAVDATYGQAEQLFGTTPRVAVELTRVPLGWRNGRRTPIPLADWLIPQRVLSALVGAYPGAALVAPDKHGRALAGDYPVELRRRRPAQWGVNEAPRGERDHERAAYDIAGCAAALPRMLALPA